MKNRLQLGTKVSSGLVLLGVAVGILVWVGGVSSNPTFAQNSVTTTPSASSAAAKEAPIDENQRSAQVFYMRRFAKSGWQRGEEIYYMKCWICHNDYTIKAEKGAAPTLRGLFKKEGLWNGDPVTEKTVMKQIKDGSTRMPAFRYTLNDKDMSDLMAYLKDKCCWDENKPEPNPRYRY